MKYPAQIRFINLINLPRVIIKCFVCLIKQKLYLTYNVKPLLRIFLENNDGSISKADIDKILNYYGLGMTFVLAEGYCLLLGKNITSKERAVTTYLGTLVGMVDDMFDEYNYSYDEVFKLYQSQQFKKNNNFEKLFIKLLSNAIKIVPYRKSFEYYVSKILKAQQITKSQLSHIISFHELEEITELKGGYSLMLFYCLFENNITDKKTKALMQLGKLMQLGNDIFDVYKDNKDGIKTIPSISTDVKYLRTYFNNELTKTIAMLYDTEWKPNDVESFLHFLFFLFSRCFVCIDQFEKLQLLIDNKFEITRYSRKDLICDMEKPTNFIKSIYYYLQIKLTQ
ncbi:MAG: class 1 isoprenoid biosynthesis enzyme [Bacteroidota bacterium]|nr:class 1 isoprenoid biosynthesis enzyme [Bacteroidota bacterium]